MKRAAFAFTLVSFIGLSAGLTWAENGGLGGLPLGLDLPNTSEMEYGYVRIANHPALEPQNLTLEAWIQPLGDGYGRTTDGSGAVLVGNNVEGGAGLYVSAYGLVWEPNTGAVLVFIAHNLGSTGSFVWSSEVVPMGTSAHVAMTFGGTWHRLYIDGQLDGEVQTSSSTIDHNSYDLLIGAANYAPPWLRRYGGLVDEVRLWDHARAHGEIAGQMDCPLFGDEPGLLAYYSFNRGNARDDSGNGHDGVFEGTPGPVDFTQACIVLFDGFESGDLSGWSSAVP